MKRTGLLACALALNALALNALAADKWVAAWEGSSHGPYPTGNAVAQPDLQALLPGAQANDQTFRLIVKPGIRGSRARIRLSNVFGSKPVTFDGVYVGVHATAGSLLAGTNRPVKFQGKDSVTVAPGELAWSDPVVLREGDAPRQGDLAARKLAVSFHVGGASGPMTWHAKAMQTSYLTRPGAGSHGAEEGADSFPFTTTSWYFLDAVEMMAPAETKVIVAFGDSITDGTNSTINGDDRWPDFLAMRTPKAVVVNAGIGGNQVVGPAHYDKAKPIGGGPSALERLERDVLSLSGVNTVIWLEAINDLSAAKASAEEVIAGLRAGVERMHAKGIRVIGATVTSALNSTAAAGTADVDARRKLVNEFIRHGGVFDAVADFDAATVDPATGALRAEYKPSSSTGGPGDGLHPNRAGYQAMAGSVDLKTLFGR